jgi:ribosomal protein L33
MAWQSKKVLLIHVSTDPVTGKKVASRYLTNKSKGKGKPAAGKLTLKKYSKELRKHVEYTETKYK